MSMLLGAVLIGLLLVVGYWVLPLEEEAVEAELETDESTAKAYFLNLETELKQKVATLAAAGLTSTSTSLNSVLATLQAELAKLS
jgi:hypothetical protein